MEIAEVEAEYAGLELARFDETAALRLELDAAGERLLRLENLEMVLRAKDLTELETLLGSYNPDNPGWWKPRGEERKEPAAALRGFLKGILSSSSCCSFSLKNAECGI